MISIVTPTFNRANLVRRLFESLNVQTCKDFEWIVIDDGSTDDTNEVIQELIKSATFRVIYAQQQNSGKHVALNKAAELISGQWTFIVDSDDYLVPNAIEISLKYLSMVQSDSSFAGVSGLRGHENGTPILGNNLFQDLPLVARTSLQKEYVDATPRDYRSKYKIPGDRAEIIRSEIFQRLKFPEFDGENFLSEFFLWGTISEEGKKLRYFNTITCIAEYLPDGLTQNVRAKTRKNPRGRSWEDGYALTLHIPVREKVIHAINYLRYGMLAGISLRELISKCPRKGYLIVALPMATIMRIPS